MMPILNNFIRVLSGLFLILVLISSRLIHVGEFYVNHPTCDNQVTHHHNEQDHSHISEHSATQDSDSKSNEHQSITALNSTSSESSSNQDPQNHEQEARHCHGSQCIFILSKNIKNNFVPATNDMLRHQGKILGFSFGTRTEKLEPPKFI